MDLLFLKKVLFRVSNSKRNFHNNLKEEDANLRDFIQVSAVSRKTGIVLSLMNKEQVSDSDQLVASRYDQNIELLYTISKNRIIIHGFDKDTRPSFKGFPYKVALKRSSDVGIEEIPFKVVTGQSNESEEQNLKVLFNEDVDLLTQKELPVIVRKNGSEIRISPVDEKVVIKHIWARYKERPVYADIARGVEIGRFRDSFKETDILYKEGRHFYEFKMATSYLMKELKNNKGDLK